MKEGYQYGYAHALEDVVTHLASTLKTHIYNNPEYDEIFKVVFEGMMETLSVFAENTKKKELKDYE